MAGEYLSVSDELKNYYPKGTFPDAVDKSAPYRASLKRVSLKAADGIATFPLALDSSWNVGMIADNASFPTPIDPVRPQGQVKPELLVGSFQIGIKTKYTASNQAGTFNPGGILADRVERTIDDLAKYTNMVYSGSNLGRLALVESDGSNNFIASQPLGIELIKRGMRLETRDALTGGAIRDSMSNQKVTGVTRSTRTITYAGTDRTLVAGDHVFVYGTYGRTIYTLPMIVDDGTNAGTIFTKSRTTYPGLKSQVLGNGGALRNLTEQIILDCCDLPRRETGKRITRVLSNSGQGRKYVEFVGPQRRYPGPTKGRPSYSLGYGKDSLQIVAPDVDCNLEADHFDIPPREMYFLAWDTFGLFESMATDWIDEDSLLKLIPESGGHKAGFLAYAGSVENQINTMPAASSRGEDLKDPICGD
jgi:hypothetical protein